MLSIVCKWLLVIIVSMVIVLMVYRMIVIGLLLLLECSGGGRLVSIVKLYSRLFIIIGLLISSEVYWLICLLVMVLCES